MFKILTPLFQRLKFLVPLLLRYKYFLGAIVVLSIFSFVVLRIGALSSPEANEQRYNEGVMQIKNIRFDQDAIETINKLNPTSVKVGEKIEDNRTNPF